MEEQVSITAMTYGSAAIGRLENGKAVFVEGAMPGDTVMANIQEEKASFCRGTVSQILEASPSRIQSPCPYADLCGGCPWSHMSYEAQLAAKRENLMGNLTRIGKMEAETVSQLVADVVPSKHQWHYRNKIELAAGTDERGQLQVGMHRRDGQGILPVDTCLLAHKKVHKAPKALKGSLRFIAGQGQDLNIFRVGLRHSNNTGDTEVALWTPTGPFPRSLASRVLQDALKTTSLTRVMAAEGKVRKVKKVEVLSGKGFWREDMGEARFMVSSPSFFQVNTRQAETLVDTVLSELQIDEDSRVADLYAGGGTFSIPLAMEADMVYAVESAASSVRDLKRNAEYNQVWVDVIGGDSARELPKLGNLDALVVDPPAAGLDKSVPASIAAAGPTQVAYVSCDPATLARDLLRFKEQGYEPEKIVPVDMFPQTYHLETIAILRKSK